MIWCGCLIRLVDQPSYFSTTDNGGAYTHSARFSPEHWVLLYCTSTHKRRNGLLLEADTAAAVAIEVVRTRIAMKLPTMSELLYVFVRIEYS